MDASSILLLGVAYKAGVEDCRHAPSFTIWEALADAGATVEYYDNHVPVIPHMREHLALYGHKSICLSKDIIIRY